MNTKIQELTDKIYEEGVEKGKEEAQRIISEAEARKRLILEEAENKARQIIAEAKKTAAELKDNTEKELRMSAEKSVNALKTEITNLVSGKVVSDNIRAAVTDHAFMQKVIFEMAKEWAKNGNIVIGATDAKSLTDYFEANAKGLIDKGVKIEQVNGQKASFTLAPSDGTYKISFGEEEFVEYFKDFLRPQLVEMLF